MSRNSSSTGGRGGLSLVFLGAAAVAYFTMDPAITGLGAQAVVSLGTGLGTSIGSKVGALGGLLAGGALGLIFSRSAVGGVATGAVGALAGGILGIYMSYSPVNNFLADMAKSHAENRAVIVVPPEQVKPAEGDGDVPLFHDTKPEPVEIVPLRQGAASLTLTR